MFIKFFTPLDVEQLLEFEKYDRDFKLMPVATTPQKLSELYRDAKACARLVGLSYIEDETSGITRIKQGKGFRYRLDDQFISDKKLKNRIAGLVIPPAWQEVWICPDERGHVLATGIDDRGRKQYIYNPKWRTVRDLIKFYRLIIFARALPRIRRQINQDLARAELDKAKVIGVMLWLLDNTYLRVGNETYFVENESVGLTTLSRKNLVVAGPVITLNFKGKSGKMQQITFDNKQVAEMIKQLIERRGERLFRYRQGSGYRDIDATLVNQYLHEVAGEDISAKDFRTWGGTLMAFNHLVETEKSPVKTPAPEKVVVEAVDAAAAVLGNTRAVAKSSYVHPDILEIYGHKNFKRYYAKASRQRIKNGLDKRETELLYFLEQLLEEEFELLKR